jgi:hypothetical protein
MADLLAIKNRLEVWRHEGEDWLRAPFQPIPNYPTSEVNVVARKPLFVTGLRNAIFSH